MTAFILFMSFFEGGTDIAVTFQGVIVNMFTLQFLRHVPIFYISILTL